MKHFIPLLLFAVSTPVSAAPSPSAGAIIDRVDAVRVPDFPNQVISMQLKSTMGRRVEPSYSYVMRLRRGAGELVEALDGEQRGQKYLSTADGYWLYAPRTSRALRLSPLQLVRGQASIGDISRLRLSNDYTASYQKIPSQTVGGIACWALDLKAKSPKATYATIRLFASKADGRPVLAELVSAAGRHLKTVKFGSVTSVSGQRIVQETTFIDAIDPSRSTMLRINRLEQAATPASTFRPQALGLGT